MADINFGEENRREDVSTTSEQELRASIELLFFAYRDFTSDPDAILREYGYGRAHHRVIHFVGRKPGLSVAELLGILRITKQSLSRVLKQLLQDSFVEQRIGQTDRRQRLLYLTQNGIELERKLSTPQQKRFADAFRAAGPESVAGYWKVLSHIINAEDRAQTVAELNRLRRSLYSPSEGADPGAS